MTTPESAATVEQLGQTRPVVFRGATVLTVDLAAGIIENGDVLAALQPLAGRAGLSLGGPTPPPPTRAAVARARGGGEDKGRRFTLAGTDQSQLSQAIRARGKVAPRDTA